MPNLELGIWNFLGHWTSGIGHSRSSSSPPHVSIPSQKKRPGSDRRNPAPRRESVLFEKGVCRVRTVRDRMADLCALPAPSAAEHPWVRQLLPDQRCALSSATAELGN